MAASEKVLGALHVRVTEVLMEALDGEVLPGYGEGDEAVPEKRIPPSAAIIAAATKFLKDNEITCTPAESNALGELEARMAQRRAKRSGNVIDFGSAAEAANNMAGYGS